MGIGDIPMPRMRDHQAAQAEDDDLTQETPHLEVDILDSMHRMEIVALVVFLYLDLPQLE